MVMEEVEALYAYSYNAADGRKIEFNAGEKFTLLSKANDDWWHVKRNGEKPMYVPANYVRELEINEDKKMKDDKLVLLTTRSNSAPSNNGSDNNGVYDNSDSSVFKDEEDGQSTTDTRNEDKGRLLSPGIRSLAKSLQNVSCTITFCSIISH